MPLAISIDQLPEAWVIGASGDLDYSECASFRVEVDRILREMPAAVIADFSQVEYLDSSGLGLLLSLAREYAEKGGRLVLVTDETVDGVLEMTRLQGVFTIEEDVHSALAHLRTTEPPAGGGSV